MATIELLTVANHAEVQNNLLYITGAEWDTITRHYPEGGTPAPQHLAVAMSAVVPWTEANQRHRLEVWIEDEDGQHLLEAGVDLEVGRPPGMAPGSDSRAPFALAANIQFPKAGGYRVRARLGESEKTYAFRVNDLWTQLTQAR